METLKDLLEEAKRRTILVAILVLIVAYIMSLTSSSVWINLPVSIVVLAALRRLSFEVEFRWKPRSFEGRSHHPLRQNRRQLTNYDPLLSGLPCQVAATRWRRIIDAPAVEEAVDQLTRCIIDEFVTSLWYSSITPDEEVPEELRILLNGVIAEVASRAKQVNLITLLSRDVVDLVGTHFELFREMKAKIGSDIIGSMSIEERDEKLQHAMMASRVLHPALISPDAEYKVLKKLTGGLVAVVLKRQDKQCRILRTLARELLACGVLRPVLNFASPGYINELIESLVIAKHEKELQGNEKADEAAHQRIPDPVPPKKSSPSGLEMTKLNPFESRQQGAADVDPLQKNNKEKNSKTTDDLGASTQLRELPHDIKPVKEETGPIPSGGNWAQVLDAVAQRRAQALAPEHLDNVWAKGRNYKKRESEKDATKAVSAPVISKDLVANPASADTAQGNVSPDPVSGDEASTSGELSTTSTIPTKVEELHVDIKDKSAIEQYALLFGDSKDGAEHLPGIGFSPLGTPRPCSDNVSLPKNGGGPTLSRSDFEDLLGASKNSQQSTTDSTAGQSSSRFRYHHKAGTSSQRLRRAVRLLAHRKSRSSGGALDEWNGLEGESSPFLRPGEEDAPSDRSHGSESRWRSFLHHGEMSPIRSPASESRWRSLRKLHHSPDAVSLAPVQADVTELIKHTRSTMLHCQVLGAHFDRVGSKPFAIYTIRVKDTENRTWRIQRRFRNFEQLHRRLKDMPYYNLNLPPKRFLSSSLDNSFVKERCVSLDKYLKDLLAIPSVAELHEVWDFLSENSQVEPFPKRKKRYFWLKWFHINSMAESSHSDQNRNRSSHYTSGNTVSMMRTLAVNVDDAVDDMFRQIRGVSDDISGVLKTATTGIRQRFPTGSGDFSDGAAHSSTEEYHYHHHHHHPATLVAKYPLMTTAYLTDTERSDKLVGASFSEDEYGGGAFAGGNVPGVGSYGWQSDSDVHVYSSDSELLLKTGTQSFLGGFDVRHGRFLGSRLDDTFSDGYSPVESNASETTADELGMPHEWTPPKVSVPILNLVDIIFQLQGRGWIRRQVLWMAKQILQLGMGDAIDDWLMGRIQWLRREEVVASGIQWVKKMLWPDGIFVTKHPRNLPEASAAMLESAGIEFPEDKQYQQRPPVGSFEYRLEAARRAGVVREVILEKAPTAVVNLIGRKQYARCAKDIYYFSQSTVCVKQLTFSLLEMLLTNAFPELHDIVQDVHSSIT